MTRKSKREIERAVDSLDGGNDGTPSALNVVYRDASTGKCYADREMTEPADPDDGDGQTVTISRGLVMFREQAEREGREILGPAESTPDGVDAVRVAREE